MKRTILLIPANLSIFDGEGGAGATGGTAPAAGEQTGDLSKVVYGVPETGSEQPEPKDEQHDAGAETNTDERAKNWQDMIRGDYKDLYDADVQRIVKNRLKDMDALKKQNASQMEIIDRLASKYHTDDLEQIAQAIDSDKSMWEIEADKAGMTTEQYMNLQQLQRQNAALMRQSQEIAEQQHKAQQVDKWVQEAMAVKQQYPSFNLEADLQDPRFISMLNSGVPMEDAYRAKHFDELQNQTARQTEAAVAANVRAKGSRPVENGVRQQSSFVTKSDVTKLTKADRAEIARRVQRGEMIRF